MSVIERWQALKEKKQSIDIELAKLEERKNIIKQQIQDRETELKAMGVDFSDLDSKIKFLEQDLDKELNQYSDELDRVSNDIKIIKNKVI